MGTLQHKVTNLKTFEIHIPEKVLDDLQDRLQNTRWIHPFRDGGWDNGISIDYLKDLIDYWQNEFDWRKQEAALNSFHQYKVNIGDYHIHFVKEQGEGPDRIPLLMLHGWPDSFYRFHKIIPMLTDRVNSNEKVNGSFDIIVPSLPGFGFTDCPLKEIPEQHMRHVAELLYRLMTEVLGYNRFAIVGGDGGSPLAQLIAIHHPESVIGIYLTDLGWHVLSIDQSLLSKKEKHYLEAGQKSFMKQGAYAMVQGTKPQTIAYSLTDSPVGLAAWIMDRFHFWCDGEIEDHFSKDELLTNIMIYWVAGNIASSIRGYRIETISPSLTTKDYVKIPVGLGLFPKDIGGIPPREFAERTLNVQHWKEMSRGGHFTAWEEPEMMAEDIRKFFGKLKK